MQEEVVPEQVMVTREPGESPVEATSVGRPAKDGMRDDAPIQSQTATTRTFAQSAVFYTPPHLPMECSWSAHGVHGVFVECSWSAPGVLVECSWSPWSP